MLRRDKKLKTSDASGNLPPGPRGIPILGNLPFLGSELHVCLKELADAHGPIFSLRLGAKLCVVLTSPETVKGVLKDQDAIFANRDVPATAIISSYGGKNIAWAPNGPYWRMIRKVTVRELLCPATISDLYVLRKAELEKMVDKLRSSAGKPINVRDLVHTTTMSMTTEMLWGGMTAQDGAHREALERELLHVVESLVELLGMPNISDFYPALAWLDLQGRVKRMRKLSSWLGRILDSITGERLNSVKRGEEKKQEKKRDFLQVLLDIVENPTAQVALDMDGMKALLLDMISGGTDTTSTTMEWAMAELLHHPEKMKRVKEEIAAVVGEDVGIEEAHLHRLTYLDAVVKEVLRLHPVLPLMMPHSPSSTCTIAGYRIPKGTKVLINVWAIQRDPSLWEDALEFRPERFLCEEGRMDYSGSTFRYLPFGAGRRRCAGTLLGERMVMFTLATLLHAVNWSPVKDEAHADDLKETFGLVMRKEKPLVAIPYLF
ncbi:flavonoid 3'-monooxygenase CYP75B137-like isoform X2 [Wolffia australiana]